MLVSKKAKGGELTFQWKPLTQISLDFSYSYISAKNELDEDIADIPNQMANLATNWQISDNWHWYIAAKWLADHHRASSDPRPATTDYTLVNTKLSRKNIISGLDAGILVNNLLDKNASDPSDTGIANDFPLPGRQVLFELSYSF